jgi:uncharacterized membrane protein
MAKKKFDTNPLDPDFPAKVQQEAETTALPRESYQTAEFPRSSVTEEQTRRFETQNFDSYQSPYDGQQIPTNYKPQNFADVNHVSDRKVQGIGISEKWLTGLPYIPWYIGLIAGLVILFIVPKSETKVRFHAAQGLAAHLGILFITTILGFVGGFTEFASIGNGIFQIVTMVMLIIFAVKAWQGKPVHIESVDDLTNWLEDKIKPSK